MDEKLKAKWVKALRSGKYEQGPHLLHNDSHGTYCCLGVLRAVADPGSHESKYSIGKWLTSEQEKRYGLEEGVQGQLGDLNDEGVPFDVIAGLIDEAL